ncbi:hypothetical protein J699_02317 [Acinetobacter sp. 1000160]|jgi:hypothetical protein|nr:hypothetical protein J522_1768 [Acinetobacter baumannii 146457]EYT19884.1 hypothetical protein J699_02317 [Acinetobacter sp. 1000160]
MLNLIDVFGHLRKNAAKLKGDQVHYQSKWLHSGTDNV